MRQAVQDADEMALRLRTGIECFTTECRELIDPTQSLRSVCKMTGWTEGPVWDADQDCLYFSNIPENRIYRWSQEAGLSVHLEYSGLEPGLTAWRMAGSNGLAMGPDGSLLICQHGNRRIVRHRQGSALEIVASHFRGKRLNSPNDLTIHSPSGDLYFTDPSYGLPGNVKGRHFAKSEQSCTGVYRLPSGGELQLVAEELKPNGLVFSPDGGALYITDETRIVRCERRDDGSLGPRMPSFIMPSSEATRSEFDGLAMTADGYLLACNWHSGIFIIRPDGMPVGVIRSGDHNANCAMGGCDGQTLFVATASGIVAWNLVGGLEPRQQGN